MTYQVVEPASFTKTPEQHVTRRWIYGDETTRIGAKVVMGVLCQPPVFDLSSPVALFYLVIAERDGLFVLQCMAVDDQKHDR